MTSLEKAFILSDLDMPVPPRMARRAWTRACTDADIDVLVALARRHDLPDDVEAQVAATTTLAVRLAWIGREPMPAADAEVVLAGDARAGVIKAAAATWPDADWSSKALLNLFTARPCTGTANLVLRHLSPALLSSDHVSLIVAYVDPDAESAVHRGRFERMWSALSPATASALCSWPGLADFDPDRLAALLATPGRDAATLTADTAALAETAGCNGSTHTQIAALLVRSVTDRRLDPDEPVSVIVDSWLATMADCQVCPAGAYDQAAARVAALRCWSPPRPPTVEDPLTVLARLGARDDLGPAPTSGEFLVWTRFVRDYELSRTLSQHVHSAEDDVAGAAWKVAARAAVMPDKSAYYRAFTRFGNDPDVCAHLYMLLGCTFHWDYSKLPDVHAERVLSILATQRSHSFGWEEVAWCATTGRIGSVPFALVSEALAGRDNPAMRFHGAAVVAAVAAGIETCDRPEEMWALLDSYAMTFTGTTGELLEVCADICGQRITDARLAPPPAAPTVLLREPARR